MLVSNLYDDFGRRQQINRDTVGSISSFTFDEISRLKGIGHNLDGTASGNDVGIGFSYNPASQVVARTDCELALPSRSSRHLKALILCDLQVNALVNIARLPTVSVQDP